MVLVAAQGRTKGLFWNQDPLSRKGRAGSIPALRTILSLGLIENRQSLVPQGHRRICIARRALPAQAAAPWPNPAPLGGAFSSRLHSTSCRHARQGFQPWYFSLSVSNRLISAHSFACGQPLFTATRALRRSPVAPHLTLDFSERIIRTPATGGVFDENVLIDQVLDITQRGVM